MRPSTVTLLDETCQLSLRDRAIVIIARFCGLRASDIAALRMTDIDLSHSRLSIRQHKTGQPLEQVLRPVVGNAVCRYVMEERPESGLPEMFLVDEREARPFLPAPSARSAIRHTVLQASGRTRGAVAAIC